MDIFEMLKTDHQMVMDIVDKLESTSDRAGKTRQKQFERLKDELLPHMFAEEKYFYPMILDKTSDKEERQTILQGIEEHRAARSVFKDCEDAGYTDERWKADLKVLKELLTHHIEEEESEIFEVAREVIEDPDEVGTQFRTVKHEQEVAV